MAPGANLPNVHANQLEVTPGDTVIVQGTALNVNVSVKARGVEQAHIRYPQAGRPDKVEAMIPTSPPRAQEKTFSLSRTDTGASFRYRIHAGDALTQWYRVTAVPRPKVTGLSLRYDYPEYTRRPHEVGEDGEGDIRAVAGTIVTVTAQANVPLSSARLQIDGERPIVEDGEIVAAEDGTTVCTFYVFVEPAMKGRWKIRLTDDYGFENHPADHGIESVADARPRVRATSPPNG